MDSTIRAMEGMTMMLDAINVVLRERGFRPYVGGRGPDTWTNGRMVVDTNEDVFSHAATWSHADTPVSVRAAGDDATSLAAYLDDQSQDA